jgi:hypothetical protein
MLTVAIVALGAPVCAGEASRYCGNGETWIAEKPIPPELAPGVASAFEMDLAEARNSSFYRCAEGRLLVCTVGANLPCGKADVRDVIDSASEFCRSNPGSTSLPAYVTGHATIYEWRCDGYRAAPARQIEQVDPQGYLARYWKRM